MSNSYKQILKSSRSQPVNRVPKARTDGGRGSTLKDLSEFNKSFPRGKSRWKWASTRSHANRRISDHQAYERHRAGSLPWPQSRSLQPQDRVLLVVVLVREFLNQENSLERISRRKLNFFRSISVSIRPRIIRSWRLDDSRSRKRELALPPTSTRVRVIGGKGAESQSHSTRGQVQRTRSHTSSSLCPTTSPSSPSSLVLPLSLWCSFARKRPGQMRNGYIRAATLTRQREAATCPTLAGHLDGHLDDHFVLFFRKSARRFSLSPRYTGLANYRYSFVGETRLDGRGDLIVSRQIETRTSQPRGL